MKMTLVLAVLISVGGTPSVLGQAGRNVVFKLKPRGQCGVANPGKVQLFSGSCAGWVTVCAHSSKPGNANILSEGFTTAVETDSPWLDILELKLGADVPNNGEVNFFSPSIQSQVDGTQIAVANVIFETTPPRKTMTIPAGETSSKALIDIRIALDTNIPEGSPDTTISLSDKATINGFPQFNQVTEAGLSLLADIRNPDLSVENLGRKAGIDLTSCALVARPNAASPFDVTVSWTVRNECVTKYSYTTRVVAGCPDQGFTLFVDGEPYPFTATCKLLRFDPPAGCADPPVPSQRDFTQTVRFNANVANGYHKFKVCAEYIPDCGADPSPIVVCSNECVSFVPVIQADCASSSFFEGPYWCTANSRMRMGDSNGNLRGNSTVRDFDLLNGAQQATFLANGPKLAFEFKTGDPDNINNFCIVKQTLFALDSTTGAGILYLDPDWLPSNNAGDVVRPTPVPGVPANVPRTVPVHIFVYSNGTIVDRSVASCPYVFGWKRGDANLDQVVDLLDAVAILNGIFMPGANATQSLHFLSCQRSANANGGAGASDNGLLNISDAIYLLNFVVLGGPQPLSPFNRDPVQGFGIVPSDTLPECVDPWGTGSAGRVLCR